MKRFASVFLPLAVTAVVLAATVASSTTLAGESTVAGAGITAVKIVRSSTGIGTDGNFTNFASWQNVPGATLTIRVPAGTRALIVARFFAESTCVKPGDTSETFCALRIKIGGKEALPGGGFNFAFDSANQGGETTSSGEGHSMERSRGPLRAGTYTVQLQWGVHGPGSTIVTCSTVCFFLNDWSFSAERVLVRS